MAKAMMISKTGNPEVLAWADVSVPQPASNEVLIRNHAVGVNFIDTIIRRGEMPEGMMPALPHVPGVEGAGVVEAFGADVQGFVVGDRVAWTGPVGSAGYGDYSVIAAPYVTKLADGVDFTTAAAIPVNAMTAWHMLVNLGHASAGGTVLVHAAAGGVGTMAIHLAKDLGLTVIASASTAKQDYVKAQGADYVIDYRSENVTARVKEITNGRGVDLTLNPIAGDSLKADMEALAPLGTAIVFGFLGGMPAGTFAEDMAQHFGKSIAVRVSDIYTYSTNKPQAFQQDMAAVFDLLRQGILKPEVSAMPLQDAAEAHRRLENGSTTGKLVLTID